MDGHPTLWADFPKGMASLVAAIVIPIAWLAIMALPYGVTCLITGRRLRKGCGYLHFLPPIIKEITRPLRRPEGGGHEPPVA